MIQYKLISEYPGSPKLGTIHSDNSKNIIWQGTIFYDANPKFWQKVEEKVEELDYEILSFIYKNNYGIVSLRPNGKYIISTAKDNEYPGFSLKEQLKDDRCSIYSVKRLSDGEVFTIGDKIDFGCFRNKCSETIEKLKVDFFDNTRITAWNSYYGKGAIDKWKKLQLKAPLFTTEDGVKIFEGDKFSIVQSSTFQQINECKFPLSNPFNWLSFSNKEETEKYILFNKPLLSLNDLVNNWGDANAHIIKSSPLFNRFLEFAKSKL